MKSPNKMKRISSLLLALALVLGISAAALAATSLSSEQAKELAYADAGISADDVAYIDNMVQFRTGSEYFYKFVFRTATTKYVYIVNSGTGEITNRLATPLRSYNTGGGHHSTSTGGHHSSGNHHGNNWSSAASNTVVLTQEEALELALKQANITAATLKKQEVELKYWNSVYYYEVELETTGDSEYEYHINAETGAVISNEVELSWSEGGGSKAYITSEEALTIALTHAGVSASGLKRQEVEFDGDDGMYYYEVELKTQSGGKYEYEINASTGVIMSVSVK